ncbi:hypothetical protein F2P45_09175 [Massilia sp. CCM 8733]|uniref:Uncharacterized protein n=1 Tax=Massilia mucilaginosa TaxID=2609282 RepID=A0ABX0NRC1_9BURK|nr:DUF6348 family protein [Massilia mucilaginosa]NHZ89187.1 hypothetical protein [Massilia mucilaginosa]
MSIPVDSRYLQVLFEGHGMSSEVLDGWVLPEGRRPAIRAEWYPNRNGFSGVFNVRVLMPDGQEFQEACSGMGTGDDGIDDGFVKFTENAFHVLLAALWGRDQEEQVCTEVLATRDGACTAYLGPFLARGTAHFPPELPERIEECIRQASLPAEIHWLRFFFGNDDGTFTFEALNNGEPWDDGLRALEGCAWTPSEHYYTVRTFMVLRRVAPG